MTNKLGDSLQGENEASSALICSSGRQFQIYSTLVGLLVKAKIHYTSFPVASP